MYFPPFLHYLVVIGLEVLRVLCAKPTMSEEKQYIQIHSVILGWLLI